MKEFNNKVQTTGTTATESSVDIDSIIAVPIQENERILFEPGTRIEVDANDNNFVFLDEDTYGDGRIIMNGDLDQYSSLLIPSIENLQIFYTKDLFEFKMISQHPGVYKFSAEAFSGEAISVIVLEDVKEEILNIINGEGCIVISAFGDLYLVTGEKAIDTRHTNILDSDCKNTGHQYEVYDYQDGKIIRL